MDLPKKPKTGGRKRGTPNKATADLKKSVSDLLDMNWNTIQADILVLKPVERLAFIEKLLAYCLPKPQTIDLQADVKTRLDRLDNEQLSSVIDHVLAGKTP